MEKVKVLIYGFKGLKLTYMRFKETVLCKLSLHKYLKLIVPGGLKAVKIV